MSLLATVEGLRATFESGVTMPRSHRLAQLAKLEKLMVSGADEFRAAMSKDLRQSAFLTDLAEIDVPLKEVREAQRHLATWMEPTAGSVPLVMQPGSAEVRRVPFGVVLIIAPFNYPISLALKPLVGALAAGNTVLIKPSELTPNCSAALSALFAKYFDPSQVAIVEGGVAETTELLSYKWDKILFTGSATVGRVVMRAAAEHLTPVILELGGKSPTLVDRSANLSLAAKRIVWGKFSNCGQTCVSPDYVLVHEDVEEELLAELRAKILEFYGDDPQASPDYSRIVNERHTERVAKLIDSAGAHIYHGGRSVDVKDRYIEPTILRNPPADSAVMQEEIFGPVLPVVSVPSMAQAIGYVNRGARPLALYVFANDAAVSEKVLATTSSGGAAVNDTMLHVVVPSLPFGGIGESGMGSYNGEHSFKAFSHERSVLWKPSSNATDPFIRYPPYTDTKISLFRTAYALEDKLREIFPLIFVVLGALLFGLYPLEGTLF